jgi:hypothetical protein
MGGTKDDKTKDKDKDKSADDHDVVKPTTTTTAPGPGLAKVNQLLAAKHPDYGEIGAVVAVHSDERDAIVAVLHADKRIGNAGTEKILKYAADPYWTGNYGADPTNTDYMKDAHQAEGGGNVAAIRTKPREAIILNDVRAAQQRFNASFMTALQKTLGVADASGAFNTETLQALLQKPQLSAVAALKSDDQAHHAAQIILRDDGQWLEALVPKEEQQAAIDKEKTSSADARHPEKQQKDVSFAAFTKTHEAWDPHTAASNRLSTSDVNLEHGHRADRVAKALGYDSYRAYHGTWHDVSFLGGRFGSQTSPAMNERLAVAERWLRQRHSGKPDNKIREAIGWNGSGAGAYRDSEAEIGANFLGGGAVPGVHMHTFGLAIDIDVDHNPYTLGGSDHGGYWNRNMETHLRRAAQLYGGEALTAARLMEWSQTMSTEELFAKVEKASESMKLYLAEPKKLTVDPANAWRTQNKGEKGADYKKEMDTRREAADATRVPVLAKKFLAINYSKEEADRAARDWLDFTLDHHGHGQLDEAVWNMVGRRQSDGLTTHTQDLIIALRDVAGLMWGGTEMHSVENGDFMHFDLRNTSYGQAVLAAHGAQLNAEDKTLDAAAAKEAAKKPPATDPSQTVPKAPAQ